MNQEIKTKDLVAEVNELDARGLLKGFRDSLQKGQFLDFHMFLSFAEGMRNTEYKAVREHAEMYNIIRGINN